MIGRVREFWVGLPKRLRVLTGVVLVLLMVLSGFGVWQVLQPKQVPVQPETTEKVNPGAAEFDFGKNAGRVKPSEPTDVAGTGVTGFKFEVDEDGFAVMPKTQDPKIAAAGAAAVMLTMNADKHKDLQAWRDEVVNRVVWPSPDYVGGVGQTHNFRENTFQDAVSLDPVEVFKIWEGNYGHNRKPENYYSWLINNADYWSGLEYSGSIIEAEPVAVLTDEEVRQQLDPNWEVSYFDDYDLTPDKPGATINNYWVRVKLNQVRGKEILPVEEYVPMGFRIWCDAPEDGGLCGVFQFYQHLWPGAWNMKDYGRQYPLESKAKVS